MKNMKNAFPVYWLPPDLKLEIETEIIEKKGIPLERFQLTPMVMKNLVWEMKARKADLIKIPAERIINVLHQASLEWLNVEKDTTQPLIKAMAFYTGFSQQMVKQSIGHEMESSLGPEMKRAIENEIGKTEYLDGFTYNPKLKGDTFAVGPHLVGGIVSSNIPALSHLTVMRSLLVKAPCVVKTSLGEPFFLPAYVQTLWNLDKDVGRSVAVVNFSRYEEGVSKALLEGIDFLIAYGSLETIDRLKLETPPGLRTLFHGHKMGFGLISVEGMNTEEYDRMAAGIAYDVVLYDQEACLAPHVVFFEGSFEQGCRLAARVAGKMETRARQLPPAQKPLSLRLAIRQQLDSLIAGSKDCFKIYPAGTIENGLVIVQTMEQFEPSPLGRIVRIVPVNSLGDALSMVEPLAGMLQNASIQAPAERRKELGQKLALMGVCRICPPGNMGMPSMVWHHDGKPCIAEMLRFTDFEARLGEKLDPNFPKSK